MPYTGIAEGLWIAPYLTGSEQLERFLKGLFGFFRSGIRFHGPFRSTGRGRRPSPRPLPRLFLRTSIGCRTHALVVSIESTVETLLECIGRTIRVHPALVCVRDLRLGDGHDGRRCEFRWHIDGHLFRRDSGFEEAKHKKGEAA